MVQALITLAMMVAEVKAFALEHYEENGWDTVVECWEDNEIAEEIKNCRTVRGAIRKMERQISHFSKYRDEIRSTAF